MGTTTLFNLRYPEPADVPNVQQDIKNLANDTDAALGAAISTGMILPCALTAAPTGWLICDGSAISRTTYAALFVAIGTRYGAGNGTTTFNLPDGKGRSLYGGGGSLAVGANDGQAAANRRPQHRTTNALGHNLTLPNHVHSLPNAPFAGGGNPGGSFASMDAPPYLTSSHNSANPSTNPAINGGITGSIGTNNANDALDAPSYLVIDNWMIKT
jgi:microcystin-dependent protein